MKIKQAIVFIVLILIVCNLNRFSLAQNVNELTDKRNEIQNQVNETNEQIVDVQEQLSDIMLQVQELNGQILEYELEANSLNIKVKELKDEIDKMESELTVVEEDYTKRKKILDNRLIAVYEAGEISYLDVLLNSASLSDFLSNMYLISEIVKMDNDLLDEIEKSKKSIEVATEVLNQKRENLKIAKDSSEKTAIALENTNYIRNQYVQRLTEEERKLQEKIEKYQEEIRNIETEIIILTTANLDSEYTGGIMAWPVPGYSRITSSFGMRTHPITGIYKLHTGVDIGAPTGARFIAVSDGVVIKANYNSAYGNMVIIDHGGGVTTLYAHGSEILVSVGQEVKRGDAVLKVGSTGYSTGPHAHFEVRVNGEYVNPITYIQSN